MKTILFCLSLFALSQLSAQSYNLGPDQTLCAGDPFPTFSIDSDYDDEDYDITWYNNGTLIQTGGVVLTAPYSAGQVKVEIYFGSEAIPFTVSDIVNITIQPLTANAVITSPGYNFTVSTHYGPMSIRNVSCYNIIVDGSASTCENSYFIDIVPFDPSPGVWSATGPSIYSGWTSGQAPSNITINSSYFPAPNTSGYYLMTFAVGPIWTPTYVLFRYECLTR